MKSVFSRVLSYSLFQTNKSETTNTVIKNILREDRAIFWEPTSRGSYPYQTMIAGQKLYLAVNDNNLQPKYTVTNGQDIYLSTKSMHSNWYFDNDFEQTFNNYEP